MISAIPRNTRREAVRCANARAVERRYIAACELDDIQANIEAVDGASCCPRKNGQVDRAIRARRDARVAQLSAIVKPTPLRDLLAERRARRLAVVR